MTEEQPKSQAEKVLQVTELLSSDKKVLGYGGLDELLNQISHKKALAILEKNPQAEKVQLALELLTSDKKILGREGLNHLLERFTSIDEYGDCDFPCHRCGFNTPRFQLCKPESRNRRKIEC